MIAVRLAVFSDAERIAQVHVDAWQSTYDGLLPKHTIAHWTYERRKSQWEQHLANKSNVIWVALRENAIVGFAFALTEPPEALVSNCQAMLSALYIRTYAQRLGAGKLLLRKIAESLLSRGCQRMSVSVLSSNASAQQFYKHMGASYDANKVTETKCGPLMEAVYVFDLVRLLR